MAKNRKKRTTPLRRYIQMQRDWAKLCRETVYGRKVAIDGVDNYIFNFHLDDSCDYHCVGLSSSVKKKGEYRGSGTYRAYKLLAMADDAEWEALMLTSPSVLDMGQRMASSNGYADLEEMILRSMEWDEKAQEIRSNLFEVFK